MVLVGTNKVCSTPSSMAALFCSSEQGGKKERREAPSTMALAHSHFSKCSCVTIMSPCLHAGTLPKAVGGTEAQAHQLQAVVLVTTNPGPDVPHQHSVPPCPGPQSPPTLKLCGLNPPRPHTCLTSFPISPLQVGPCGLFADFLSQNRTGAFRSRGSGGLEGSGPSGSCFKACSPLPVVSSLKSSAWHSRLAGSGLHFPVQGQECLLHATLQPHFLSVS